MIVAAKVLYWAACLIATMFFQNHLGVEAFMWEWIVLHVAFYCTACVAYDALRTGLPVLATYRLRVERRDA